MQDKPNRWQKAKTKVDDILPRIREQGKSRELLGELWEAVLPLVRAAAWRYGGAKAEDLTQEAYFVLLHALDDHDAEQSHFLTFFNQRVIYAFYRASNISLIRLPAHVWEAAGRADRTMTTGTETAESPLLKAQIAARNALKVKSLDEPIGEDGDTLSDIVGANDGGLQAVEDDIYTQELREALLDEIRRLPPQRAQLVERIYLQEDDPQEVGSELGMTAAKAREVARNGVEMMKTRGARSRLRPWADECGLYSTSFRSWKHTGMSAPERIAIQRAERLERWKEQYYAKRANGQ